MLINKTIDDELKENIFCKDWSDVCADQNYSTDLTVKNQFHTEMYNKISVDIENYIDKILAPFDRNSFYVKRKIDKMSHYWDEDKDKILCSLNYDIQFIENKNTNPFSARVDISVHKDRKRHKI